MPMKRNKSTNKAIGLNCIIFVSIAFILVHFYFWCNPCTKGWNDQYQINIKSGKKRLVKYRYFLKISDASEETIISKTFDGSLEIVKDDGWRLVHIHYPFYEYAVFNRWSGYHAKYSQAYNVISDVEKVIGAIESRDEKKKFCKEILRLWQVNGGNSRLITELIEIHRQNLFR